MTYTTAAQPSTFHVGDFVSEVLVTDTRVYRIAKRTEKVLYLQPCGQGEKISHENIDGNPYPVVYTEAVPYEGAELRRVGLRADGTFRTCRSGAPLRPAHMIDGKPVTRTDYRY